MIRRKRSRTHTVNHADNTKRKKLTNLSNLSTTRFENFSNEVLYEIFDFLDFYHAYKAFSNLNQRFHNLIINSKLPIRINISSLSKSEFEDYYTNIILPHLHRIKSLNLSNRFAVNLLLPSSDAVLKFIQLETLILKNIEPSFLKNINFLMALPRLYSLVIISNTDARKQANVFYEIFRLPVLRYCKVSFGQGNTPILLPFATNKYSSIEHLVINNDVHLDLLYSIFSYVPQLRRLSIDVLFDSGEKKTNTFSIVLNHLTHISLQFCSVAFHNFELLVENFFHNLQVLYICAGNAIKYLDANRWQHLIMSHMSNLNVFDLQYIYCLQSDENVSSTYDILISKFNSSFWIERQWYFTTQYPCGRYQNKIIFYSITPYRRKNLTLDGVIKDKKNFDSVEHLHIKSIRSMINCMSYFPNTTTLTLSDHFDIFCQSIGNSLTRIIPLKQITKLVIDYDCFCFTQLIQLLSSTVNLHTLKISSISLSGINLDTTERNIKFQFISIINSVKNLILKQEWTLEKIQLLAALLPRLQHLTMNGFDVDTISIIQSLLSKNNNHTRHLSSLCIVNVNEFFEKSLKLVIDKEKLLDDYSMKFTKDNIYLWW